jgi:cullin-associated NEDD8-dissociated protein 1
LSSLKHLLQFSKGHEDYHKNCDLILDIILASLKNDHFSVKAEGLLATSSFTKILSLSGTDKTQVGHLNEVVLSCMDASENAIIAVSHILSSCHNSLSKAQIETNIDILIEKLKNDMKRIAALRAINRICASDCSLKPYCEDFVTSVNPLLAKSDNNVKINSLIVLDSFIGKYGGDLTSKHNEILSSTLTIITTENLQVADYALDLLSKLCSFKLDSSLITEAIQKVTSLTESSFLVDKTIQKILNFFRSLASHSKNVDFEESITFLQNKVSISCTVPARCIAEILAKHSDLNSKFSKVYFDGLNQDDNTVIVSSLILGEIGRLNDLSGKKDLTQTIDALFNHTNSDVKIAASHCLGHVCIGNLKHFLPIVISFIESEPKHRFLLLMSIREIIDTKLSDVSHHFETISNILFDNAKSSEEKIRNVVSECLGKLFAAAGLDMLTEFESRLSSPNQVVRSTIAKSFKYAATRETDATALSSLLPDIIDLASDSEHQIRQFTLESLISIAHHLPELIKNDVETLFKIIYGEVEVKKELIKEVDLGPFKHKIDEGRPIRKAGFVLLDTIFEKMPEKINVPVALDTILIGLSDPDDDCVSQTLHILIKLIRWAPGAVVGQMSNILEKLPAILKEPAKGTTKTSIRIAVKALERMSNIPEMETNTSFQKFIQDNNVTFEE